jgi:hypothetical protein
MCGKVKNELHRLITQEINKQIHASYWLVKEITKYVPYMQLHCFLFENLLYILNGLPKFCYKATHIYLWSA